MYQAQQRLSAELSALDNGTAMVNTGKETLGCFLARWLETTKGTLSPRTWEGYQTILNRIIPVIGGLQLRKVSPADLQGYISTMPGEKGRFDEKGGLSPLTVVHHHRLLHRALQDALAWGLIARNPVDLVKSAKSQWQANYCHG